MRIFVFCKKLGIRFFRSAAPVLSRAFLSSLSLVLVLALVLLVVVVVLVTKLT